MPRRLLLSSFFVLSFATLVSAAPPLDLVTRDAEVIIRLHDPKSTIDKAAEMAATVRSSLGDQMRTWGDGLGLLISNPTMAGVDRSRDWHVAVFAHADADPDVVFIIPATDPEVLQAALPDGMPSFVREDWVYYCEQEEALKQIQQNRPSLTATAAASAVPPGMTGESGRIFNDADMAVFVNMKQVGEIYADRLDSGQTQLEESIKRRLALLAMIPGFDPDALVGNGSKAISQSIQDCTSVTLGAFLGNEGVRVESYAQFADESPTAETVGGLSTAGMNSLTKLPPDSLLYVGVAGGLARRLDLGLVTSMSLIEPDEKQRQQFDELEASAEQVDYDNMVGALGLGDSETGYIRFVGITSASPTADLRAVKQHAGELLNGEDSRQALTQSAEYEADAESYDDEHADLLTISQEIDPDLNPFFAQIMSQFQKTLHGPDGLQVRLLYKDNQCLQSVGGGRTAMQRAVADFTGDSGNGLDGGLEHLIAEPSIVLLLDVQRIVNLALREASKSPLFDGLPLDPSSFGGTNTESSYVGVSLAPDHNALRGKSLVPPVQLIRMIQYGILMRMLQQQ